MKRQTIGWGKTRTLQAQMEWVLFGRWVEWRHNHPILFKFMWRFGKFQDKVLAGMESRAAAIGFDMKKVED